MKSSCSPLSSAGFSLVELVLALGIATFGLVSILGLLNAAADSDGAAGHDTTLVSMSDYVLNEMHAVPFDALWTSDPPNSRNAAPSMDAPASSTYYFTNEGAPLTEAEAATSFDLLYKCVVQKTPDPLTINYSTGYYNQLKLQLTFTWPTPPPKDPSQSPPSTPAPTGKGGAKALYASIARR